MPRRLALALLALLTAASTAAARPPAPAVPPEFRGEWNAVPAACGRGTDDSQLRITARRLQFYESGGPVIAVRRLDRRTVRLTGRMTGEGETHVAAWAFRLSEGGRRLTDITSGGDFTRFRCP